MEKSNGVRITQEMKRKERHKIRAVDAIQKVRNQIEDPACKRLLEDAVKEVLKLC